MRFVKLLIVDHKTNNGVYFSIHNPSWCYLQQILHRVPQSTHRGAQKKEYYIFNTP